MLLRNGLEPGHLLVLALALILLFGSKKLPDAARALGKSLRILKNETAAMTDDTTKADVPPEARRGAAPRPIVAADPDLPHAQSGIN
ncbi:Sec-independent protein translocase subunit TatA [Sphaerisporangium sp. NBC_01403]|uniref:Sec-independent protein translocase subunit TatA n=1 Tax=Sphaerisporangium TaxID=321315 RepID=UPI003255C1A4